MVLDLGLTYDTSPEKIELARSILKQIVDERQDVLTDETLISFLMFG